MRGPLGGTGVTGTGESVPVAERLRVMQWLRAAAVLLTILAAYAAPEVVQPDDELRWQAVQGTLVYGCFIALSEVAARALRGRAVALFSGLLMLDGIWLAVTWYLTGQQGSPMQYLILLHIGAVALLASYRTGLKLAMWHSLLLYAVFNGARPGLFEAAAAAGNGTKGERLGVFIVVLWLVAVSTSALSAINERELRRRRMDLEALTELAESLERTADSSSVGRTLLDSAVDSFGFPRGVVLAGPEGQLPLLASFGLNDEIARRPGRPGPSAVVAQAHETHQVQLVRGLDPEHDPWIARLMPDARNLLVVPLSAEGRPMGALVLESADDAVGSGRISRRIVSGLERSASYAALALRNAWLLEQVQRLAATDGLTKIANRRTFEATLEREVARATRSAEHVSLVMLDIDHFKVLNDTHGHQAGDEVLRNVAAALSCECRDFDTPARYGGEEFAVVLPGCGPDEAVVIAERLRLAVAAAPSIVPITSSAGVATFPAHAGDADTLVRAADDALYRSKAAGRDRTSRSEGVPPEAQVDALLRRAVLQRLGRPAAPADADGDGAPGATDRQPDTAAQAPAPRGPG